MEKNADLAMIQKMNIDTLHKEGKVTEGHYLKGWLFTECCIKAY